MIDLLIVDAPLLSPNKCVACPRVKGPLVDFQSEIPQTGGRIYLCKMCAKRAALAFGFAKGPELDRLMDVSSVIEQKQEEVEGLLAEKAAFESQVSQKERQITALTKDLEDAHGQIELHERRAREMREAIEAAAGDTGLSRHDDYLARVPTGEDDWKDGA